MHFWIDKRSSYGFGHQRPGGMSGFAYNPRRVRSNKPTSHNVVTTPSSSAAVASSTAAARQNAVPSTSSSSSHQGKTTNHHHHHHHHHGRAARNNQRNATAGGGVVDNIIIDDSSTTTQHQMDLNLNSHHVPVVVHSVYSTSATASNESSSHPTNIVDTTSTRSNGVNQWLPIQIICGLCMILAITLVLLKLYFENYMTGFQVLALILMSFVFLVLITLLSLLRSRRKRPAASSTQQQQSMIESQLQPTTNINLTNNNNQSVIVTNHEPPPPYALALTLPEKQSNIKISTPPPSYEKINII